MIDKRAYQIYLIYKAITNGLFFMSFAVGDLYRLTIAHLDPLQLVLVGTTLEASVFLFEIPTGIIADLYSRKLSIIIGLFLIGAGFILEGSIPIFVPILIAQVFWGVGFTFTSGASDAWITDEIGEENAGTAFLKGTQVSQLGSITGIFISIFLGLLKLNFPIVVSGILFILLGFYLIVAMPETGFKPAHLEERNTLNKLKITLKNGLGMVHKRPGLSSILWIGFFYGLYSEGLDRLWVIHLIEQFTLPIFKPVVWVGLIWGTSMILVYGSVAFIKDRIDMASMQTMVKVLMFNSILILFFLISFGIVDNLLFAVLIYLFISVIRAINAPIYTTWVNHKLDSQVRATVLSMSSQIDAFGQITGGPIIGFIGRQFSIRAALIATSGLLSPVLFFLGKHTRTNNGE